MATTKRKVARIKTAPACAGRKKACVSLMNKTLYKLQEKTRDKFTGDIFIPEFIEAQPSFVNVAKETDTVQKIQIGIKKVLTPPLRPPMREISVAGDYSSRKIFSFSNSLLSILVGLIFAGMFCTGIYVLADPPGTPYNPPATLTPNCAPGSTNCTVAQVYYTNPLGYLNISTLLNAEFQTLPNAAADNATLGLAGFSSDNFNVFPAGSGIIHLGNGSGNITLTGSGTFGSLTSNGKISVNYGGPSGTGVALNDTISNSYDFLDFLHGGARQWGIWQNGITKDLEFYADTTAGGIGNAFDLSQSGNLTLVGTATVGGFKMAVSPGAGYVLTSDASGNGTWQAAAGGGWPPTVTSDLNMNNYYITNGTNPGSDNFIGGSAGSNATSATFNNFIGYAAGASATSAQRSNFIGLNAGTGSVNVSDSNFIGNAAGENVATGSATIYDSNFIGFRAGYAATAASDSTFIGTWAGNLAGGASNSIFMGDHAGYHDVVNNVTSGGTSIAIGQYSGTGGFSDSVAIGHGVINNATDQMNLGNVLKLNGIYASDTPSSNFLVGATLDFDNQLINYSQGSGSANGGWFLGNDKITQNQLTLDDSSIGATFTVAGSSQGWYGVAMSSDGKYQTATSSGGQIYISYDYGATWTATATSQAWYGVAMSSDGKYQTAVIYGGQIYVSSDYGATWAAVATTQQWLSVAMSSDGKYQTAGTGNGGSIYISNDYGATWTAATGTSVGGNWRGVAMSSDGKYQTAGMSGGLAAYVYISSNYGATWATTGSLGNYLAVAMSSDGKYQTATNAIQPLSVSSDYGATWTASGAPGIRWTIAMSSDGKYQIAPISSGFISISTDHGVTWTSKAPAPAWHGVALSSDAKYMTLVAPGNQIFVFYNTSSLRGNLTATGTGSFGNIILSNGTAPSSPAAGQIYSDGTNLWVYESSAWHSITMSSSLRFKNNIQPLADDWSKILQVQPKSFLYNNQPDNTLNIGYIAEDFDALGLKDLVQYDGQGRPSGINYDKISLYDTEIIKQQQLEINTLNQKLGINPSDAIVTPAGTSGDGTVSGVTPFDQSIQASLSDIGATLSEGVMKLKQIVVDNLTAKTADIAQVNIQKMQVVDQATGDTYCTWISNGEWQKVKGDCTSANTTVVTQTTTPMPTTPSSSETPASSTGSTSSTQSTSDQTTQTDQQNQAQTQQSSDQTSSVLDITSVAALADINVDYGTSLASANMPTTVNVTLSNNTNQTVAVTWDNGTPAYDANTPGSYTFSGALVPSGSITNTKNLGASVRVTVAQQSAPIEGSTDNSTSSLLNGLGEFIIWAGSGFKVVK